MRKRKAITVDRIRKVLTIDDDGLVVFREDNGRRKAGDLAHLIMKNGRYIIRVDGRYLDMTRVAWVIHHGEWPKFLVWQVRRHRRDFTAENIVKWTEFNTPSPKK